MNEDIMTERARALLEEAWQRGHEAIFEHEDLEELAYWNGARDILKKLLEDAQ